MSARVFGVREAADQRESRGNRGKGSAQCSQTRWSLIPELFRGSFYAHDVGGEIDNIFPALPGFFECSKGAKNNSKGTSRTR